MLKLDDKRLWGNEAADDEDPQVLNTYFVNQPAWVDFFELTSPLSIARARKGMGKSALIRECAYRTRSRGDAIVLELKGSDLVAQKDFRNLSPVEHIYDWQQRICAVINRAIGASIGFAHTDDQIALVEAAELSGLKSRNLVSALVDRLRGKIGPAELQKLGVTDNAAILHRFLGKSSERVVLLIDDIDATFTQSPEESLRLSTFFSACRQIATSYKGVVIRTVIRSDVWASIRRSDEALDKVEQYIFDIKWSVKGFRSFLYERISAYCERIDKRDLTQGKSKGEVIGLAFEEAFPWGRGTAHPHRVIHVYSGGRPRWAAQLCRMAGAEAVRSQNQQLIRFGNIKQVLEEYGRFRLDDVSREHKHQCAQISEIVNAFAKKQATYSTNALRRFIEEAILSKITPVIDGYEVNDSIAFARYLFRIGFILAAGRDQLSGNPEYFQYEEKPELLVSSINLDQGMRWRVHPAFHAALDLQTD